MKSNEALNLLDEAVAQLQTNRNTHVRLQEAVIVLREAIKPKIEVAEPKK